MLELVDKIDGGCGRHRRAPHDEAGEFEIHRRTPARTSSASTDQQRFNFLSMAKLALGRCPSQNCSSCCWPSLLE